MMIGWFAGFEASGCSLASMALNRQTNDWKCAIPLNFGPILAAALRSAPRNARKVAERVQ